MNSADGQQQQQKHGFWQTLARKARSVLDDDVPGTGPTADADDVVNQPGESQKSQQKGDGPAFHKGFDALNTSLSFIGNAVEVTPPTPFSSNFCVFFVSPSWPQLHPLIIG